MQQSRFCNVFIFVFLTNAAIPYVILDLQRHFWPEEQGLDFLESGVATRVPADCGVMQSLENVSFDSHIVADDKFSFPP